MAVTNYYSVEGEVIGEATGGVRTDYLTDALGSVTGTVNASSVVVNTYRYKPYGATLAKTGTGADPIFGWVGSAGYAGTGKAHSEMCVRARHYSSASGRWTSKDPIGQDGGDWNYYRYAENSPVGRTDPTGLSPGKEPPNQKTCQEVRKCLDKDVNGYNCKKGHGCVRHSISKSKAICVMYHESRLDPDTGPDDNGGGIGQFYKCILVVDLVASGCSKGICCKDGHAANHKGAQWCQGAQASYMGMQCRGLGPGGYGDQTYTPAQLKRFTDCEKCLDKGGACLDCMHKVLPPPRRR